MSRGRGGVGLREYFERLLAEYEKRTEERFRASEVAVQAALVAQKESNAATFAASDKAIIKAEEAQHEYNQRSNEFRGQLDDQAKTLMPRAETVLLFGTVDKQIELLRNEIASLRESRSSAVGASVTSREFIGYGVAIVAILATVLSHFL